MYTIARLTDMCSRRLESNAVVVLLVKRRIAVRFHNYYYYDYNMNIQNLSRTIVSALYGPYGPFLAKM